MVAAIQTRFRAIALHGPSSSLIGWLASSTCTIFGAYAAQFVFGVNAVRDHDHAVAPA